MIVMMYIFSITRGSTSTRVYRLRGSLLVVPMILAPAQSFEGGSKYVSSCLEAWLLTLQLPVDRKNEGSRPFSICRPSEAASLKISDTFLLLRLLSSDDSRGLLPFGMFAQHGSRMRDHFDKMKFVMHTNSIVDFIFSFAYLISPPRETCGGEQPSASVLPAGHVALLNTTCHHSQKISVGSQLKPFNLAFVYFLSNSHPIPVLLTVRCIS
ncbi:uncharacterized protein EV420DRAFT_144322 [Desarmillaria tabescens]|uniref:Uncharacterized protein n=1 Tax=Armillaria tabescens TaxID=1929756 RepID=A0AA39NAI0_ARMTA|nr:uncharacterized protein EV420DRAFT_144322 [Desarmillaria tabescens]KAK0462062.1 hypothetical protein EV420DRAFT_144322 [Desarmillaria tabescens]